MPKLRHGNLLCLKKSWSWNTINNVSCSIFCNIEIVVENLITVYLKKK